MPTVLGGFAESLADFASRLDGVIHIPGECPSLLRGVGEIAEHRRHAGGFESQQIESHRLHRQHARFELFLDRVTPLEEVVQCLPLPPE